MINNVSLKLYGRENGAMVSVYLRVVLHRRKVETLLYKVQSGCFDEKKQAVVKCTDSFRLNLLAETRKKTVLDFVYQAELNGLLVSVVDVKKLLCAPEKKPDGDFYAWIEQQIEVSNVSHEHRRHMRAALSKLRKWRFQSTFSDINRDFFMRYADYQKNELLNSVNTVTKNMSFFKVWTARALVAGLLENDPLADYKLKKKKTKRYALLWDDVLKLESLLKSAAPEPVKNVVGWFLFCCYTGLRHGDLKALRWNDIQGGFIVIEQRKTMNTVKIPLVSRALELAGTPGNGFVFKVYANQKCNEYLKIAKAWAKIDKPLTFHISRHTFATISLNLGMRLEVVSELLGHQDLKTTRIYTEMLDNTLKENMNLLDAKINSSK